MLIKDVRTTLLRAPWREAPRWSKTYDRQRELVVVEIETASGLVGMGYLMPLSGGMLTIKTCIDELLRPRLIGRDASEIEGIWKDLYQATYWTGRMGITMFAQSAVDIALWDILGKRAGLPLHRLWGSCRASTPVYGSGCWRGLGPDGMIDKAKRYVAAGFKAIKMQAGHLYDWRDDVRHLRLMREALGERIDIMIDVNMGWTADRAIEAGRRMQEYDLYWLEEPVVCEDFAGYFRVADALSCRVVGGESHFTRFDLRPFFQHPKIPMLQPDPMRGGLTELRKIAAVADTWGIAIAPHMFHELMVHLTASIPNASWLEYMDFLDDLWVEPVMPKDGMLTAPERPGHGLQFKPDALKSYAVTA